MKKRRSQDQEARYIWQRPVFNLLTVLLEVEVLLTAKSLGLCVKIHKAEAAIRHWAWHRHSSITSTAAASASAVLAAKIAYAKASTAAEAAVKAAA